MQRLPPGLSLSRYLFMIIAIAISEISAKNLRYSPKKPSRRAPDHHFHLSGLRLGPSDILSSVARVGRQRFASM
jgi:hypothetical protein